ncbi:MAG: L-rhamnonate dehydratase [Acidobacteria bacterium]|nr:L-rhamnonate dehydratase [Acidobacteriota bacterium]
MLGKGVSRRRFLCAAAAGCGVAAAAPGKHRIQSVRARSVPLLPTSRFGTSRFTSDFDPARRRWFGPFSQLAGSIVVEIRTDSGITGYGLGGGGGAAAYIVDHHLRDLLVGADPLNIELLWDQMYASTSLYGRKGLAVMAISGIDLALWDIAGKAAGLPVYRLLGGATKERVPVYFTSNQPQRGLDMGMRAFKLPIDQGVAQGDDGKHRIVQRIAEVRGMIGPDAGLMIDCLARWDVPYTLEMDRRLAGHRLRWIEEPLYPDDLEGYARLCREVRGTRIASGEHEYTRYGFAELIRHKAAHILQPDITWSGGLTELRRIATLAASAGLPFIPHRGGSLYGLHLILATPTCHLAESFGIGETGNEIMEAMTPPYEKGHIHAPEKPGFGVELNEQLLQKYAR